MGLMVALALLAVAALAGGVGFYMGRMQPKGTTDSHLVTENRGYRKLVREIDREARTHEVLGENFPVIVRDKIGRFEDTKTT